MNLSQSKMLTKYYSQDILYKIIYNDGGQSKSIKGNIIDEDENMFIVRGHISGDIMFIGKHFIIKLSEVKERIDSFG